MAASVWTPCTPRDVLVNRCPLRRTSQPCYGQDLPKMHIIGYCSVIKEHPQSPSDAIIMYMTMRTEIHTPLLSESSTAYLRFLRDKMRDDEEWTPPTEAELKVLASRRERSDKISKLMGDYMLKGYRMLATLCPICECVELQDRQGAKYCVACQEVDCQEWGRTLPSGALPIWGRWGPGASRRRKQGAKHCQTGEA